MMSNMDNENWIVTSDVRIQLFFPDLTVFRNTSVDLNLARKTDGYRPDNRLMNTSRVAKLNITWGSSKSIFLSSDPVRPLKDGKRMATSNSAAMRETVQTRKDSLKKRTIN